MLKSDLGSLQHRCTQATHTQKANNPPRGAYGLARVVADRISAFCKRVALTVRAP